MPGRVGRLHPRRHREDDGEERATVTQTPQRNRTVPIPATALERRRVEFRRQTLEDLRRIEIQLQTASALDRRADLSPNTALATMLHERAEERRRVAAVIRAHLVEAHLWGRSRPPG